MNQINYSIGDATAPMAHPAIICHVCNDIGGWGRGFVLALSKRWKAPEQQYRKWYHDGNGFALGAVQFVPVEPQVTVANMIGQHNIRQDEAGNPPIRYDAVEQCLGLVAQKALELDAGVHMPRIGCGLAGGQWEKIELILLRTICAHDIPVYVYDLT